MSQAGPFLPSFQARLALTGLVALVTTPPPTPSSSPTQVPSSLPHVHRVGAPMALSAGSKG